MFEITADKLRREADIKALKLQDENYSVTFFYYGDYESDFESGKCDMANITVSCREKEDVLPLEFLNGKFYVDLFNGPVLYAEDIPDFKKQLEIAYTAAIELQDIVKQYFGIEQ